MRQLPSLRWWLLRITKKIPVTESRTMWKKSVRNIPTAKVRKLIKLNSLLVIAFENGKESDNDDVKK